LAPDHIPEDVLRAAIVDSLRAKPGATLTEVQSRLHARIGRPLETEELERLQQMYRDEGYAAGASASVSADATKASTQANLQHARPTVKEIVGVIAAVLPLFFHFQSGTGARIGGVATTYFDLVALVGGIVALIAGVGTAVTLEKGPQRVFHLSLVVIMLGLGLYQVLLGVGLLHRFGIFHYS
jgi:hypothetical protein